jgi:hypothetical protein
MIKFLIDIAVVHALFYLIWGYAFTLLIVSITTLLKVDTFGIRLSKGLGVIVFASLSALIVIRHSTGIGIQIFYAIIAGVLMLLNLISGSAQTRQKVRQEVNTFERMRMESELENDYIYWLIALVTFILTFFIPIIGANPINKLFVYIMNWVLGINVINWIVIVFAVLYLIWIIWKGFLGLIMVIVMLKGGKNEKSN